MLMTERAKIFKKKNGKFDSREYMLWIMRCSHNYKIEREVNSVHDQDDFTEYLRVQPLEGEYL